MNTDFYYKLVVLQINDLETTIHDEKHFGTLADSEKAAAEYKKRGFVTVLLRIWQSGLKTAV